MTTPSVKASLRLSLTNYGADLIGFADLRELPPAVRQGLPFAVSIAVALNPAVVSGILHGPTREYLAEYHQVNERLAELAESCAIILRQHGHRAIPAAPTKSHVALGEYDTPLPHKTVATCAGLGWIGKCALLVTERHGSAVRLTSVLTDAHLESGSPMNHSRCGECVACVEACPGSAVQGADWQLGVPRESLLDPDACYRTTRHYAPRIGADPAVGICGVCIAACPWTQAYLERGTFQEGYVI